MLHIVARKVNVEICERLVESGADVLAENKVFQIIIYQFKVITYYLLLFDIYASKSCLLSVRVRLLTRG